jgi:hypothetical protein
MPRAQPDGQISASPVQPLLQKYFRSHPTQITFMSPPSGPGRGALAIVTNVGTGCGGRGSAFDEQRQSGRRSRVVLTPRRWRQVLEKQASWERRWQKSRSPGRSRRKPLKPLRAGMPGDFRCDRCEYSCAFFTTPAHTRLRVHWAPGIPARPLRGRKVLCTTRAHRAAGTRNRIWPSLRAKRSRAQALRLCRRQ